MSLWVVVGPLVGIIRICRATENMRRTRFTTGEWSKPAKKSPNMYQVVVNRFQFGPMFPVPIQPLFFSLHKFSCLLLRIYSRCLHIEPKITIERLCICVFLFLSLQRRWKKSRAPFKQVCNIYIFSFCCLPRENCLCFFSQMGSPFAARSFQTKFTEFNH